MYTSTKYQCGVIVIWCVVTMIARAFGANASPAAFLRIEELADGWVSHYGGITSMEASYATNLLEFTAPPDDPEADQPLSHLQVERIEQGVRHHTRYSTAKDGFTQNDKVLVQAFDGEITTDYTAKSNRGAVRKGLTKRACETMNHIRRYMLLDPTGPKGGSAGIPRCQSYLTRSDAKVLANLEQVAGEWCHVVECAWEGGHVKIWLAHDKGFLPLKYEKVAGNTYRDQRVVQEVASMQTETGVMWYPMRAERTVYSNVSGTIRTAMTASKFRVNVPVSRSTFRVQFPLGAKIYDAVHDVEYVMGTGLDSLVEIDAPTARDGELPPLEPGQDSGEANGGEEKEVREDTGAELLHSRQGKGSPMAQVTRGHSSWNKSVVVIGMIGVLAIAALLIHGRVATRRKGGM